MITWPAFYLQVESPDTNACSGEDLVIHPQVLQDLPIVEGDWDEELEALSKLQHPNFVELIGLVVIPGQEQLTVTGIIMELAGSSISDMVDNIQ
jgi:hypothetical protein